jgi:hypothetical protein
MFKPPKKDAPEKALLSPGRRYRIDTCTYLGGSDPSMKRVARMEPVSPYRREKKERRSCIIKSDRNSSPETHPISYVRRRAKWDLPD